MATLYHSDPATGAYAGATEARLDPIDGAPLVPRYATLTPPPDPAEGHLAVLQDGAWREVPDQRGVIYWLPDGTEHKITELGQTPPEGALLAKPPALRGDQHVAALAKLRDLHAGLLSEFSGNPAWQEAITWTRKLLAAEAILDGNAKDMHRRVLNRAAVENGRSIEQQAEYILGRDAFFSALADLLDAEWDRTSKLIEAAISPDIADDQVAARLSEALTNFETRVRDGAALLIQATEETHNA